MNKPAIDSDNWRRYFDSRQLGLIEDCRKYATGNPSGLPGHQLMLIINRMADLLEDADLHVDPVYQINTEKISERNINE